MERIYYNWVTKLNKSEDIVMDILEIMKGNFMRRSQKNSTDIMVLKNRISKIKRKDIPLWLLH